MVPIRLSVGLLIARLPVGFLFLLAGANKVKGGIPTFVESAAGTIPSFLPTAMGRAYLYALPILEILVGTCIVLGLFTRPIALLASLMLLSFMIAVTGLFAEGGGFHQNLVFLGVTLGLAFTGPGVISADRVLFRKPRIGKQ